MGKKRATDVEWMTEQLYSVLAANVEGRQHTTLHGAELEEGGED